MSLTRISTALAFVAVLSRWSPAQAPSPLPLKYDGPPTVPAITAGDLMTRLYRFADDSMMGRAIGTPYADKATAFIEAEVRRLGLVPAGDNGGFYQNIGMIHRAMDLSSTMSVDGVPLRAGIDFLANTYGPVREITNAPVLVWYVFDSTTTPTDAQLAGKVVAFRLTPALSNAELQVWRTTSMYRTYTAIANGSSPALGVLSNAGDSIPAARLREVTDPNASGASQASQAPLTIVVTASVLRNILGASLAATPSGTVGKAISVNPRVREVTRPGRNVIAILPGADPRLRGEYVAIGAHTDHVGFAQGAVGEHDSLHVVNQHMRPAGSEGGRDLQRDPVSPEEWAAINAEIAALRRVYPARPDSIFNGADDDGSGAVSVLEIAEAFAAQRVRPRRSILFVWHTGEEGGLRGSNYFAAHPTVPRDSIVALLNLDMVGRGAASDLTGQAKAAPAHETGDALHGGARYLQVIGSRRLSTELGDLVERVNRAKTHGFTFDYALDADGHQQNMYCRSDHWSYAKWGIPVAYFTTGGHADYHQATDEPQYIRYDHMAAVDALLFDVAAAIANLDHRVTVDHPKPSPLPATTCRQ